MIEQKKIEINNLKVKDMVQVSLMACIVYISTAIINIPTPGIFKGVVHLGDSMVLLGAILLGRKKGFFAAAIGMCLFDMLSPYIIWAPFTFFIKGFMAWIAATIAYRKGNNGERFMNNVFAFVVACIWMVLAYYVAGALMMYFMANIGFTKAFVLSAAEIPGNIAQSLVGMAIALPLSKILKSKI